MWAEASDDELRPNGSDSFIIPLGFAPQLAAQVSMSPACDGRGARRVCGRLGLQLWDQARWNQEEQPGRELFQRT